MKLIGITEVYLKKAIRLWLFVTAALFFYYYLYDQRIKLLEPRLNAVFWGVFSVLFCLQIRVHPVDVFGKEQRPWDLLERSEWVGDSRQLVHAMHPSTRVFNAVVYAVSFLLFLAAGAFFLQWIGSMSVGVN